ncbi:hypothetical protein EDEG_03618 [Edhazardia aedis USNM 41457]|uniref:Farnesyl pyrophosphate synthase n=1 Tax=Edhazardia aedis (strain USNM 41457) TaxID=1003232 RepID=J9D234_EDHAE|nr:hypothetical protein EDEG_03618 [Edhazardia aedis USNM 41457]|eukprot:EJW01916.1 hypothetical protein EDEG_03618 [Edhazardia aedis USNM 41457]
MEDEFIQRVCTLYKQPQIVTEYLKYNATGGKLFRGNLFQKSFSILRKCQEDNLQEETCNTENTEDKEIEQYNDFTRKFLIDIAMCMEILQAYFLVTDDIIDNSETRRGKRAWYRLPNIGLDALSHSSQVYSLTCEILMSNYENLSKLSEKDPDECKYLALKTFNEASLITWMGQMQDTLEKKCEVYEDVQYFFNKDYFFGISRAKTSAYTVYLPIKLGIIAANNFSSKINSDLLIKSSELKFFCDYIAYLMQMQDDYLNFYPELSGKSGTDLQERKVTFFTCKYVANLCSDEDKNDFINYLNYKNSNNYIIKLENCIFKMIEQEYDSDEQNVVNIILTRAKNSHQFIRDIVLWIIKKVHRRKK